MEFVFQNASKNFVSLVQKTTENISLMKSYRKELWFNLPARRGFMNITPQVEECLRESGIQEGMASLTDTAASAFWSN